MTPVSLFVCASLISVAMVNNKRKGEICAVKVAALASCPPIRALLMQGTPASELTTEGLWVWFVCGCIIATLVHQCRAVVGFMGQVHVGCGAVPEAGLGHGGEPK